MSRLATIVFVLVTAVHLAFFAGEALLWSMPAVRDFVLPQLNPGSGVSVIVQGEVLRALFLNQGFYNFFVSLAAVAGLVLVAQGRIVSGLTLVRFVCLFAMGAGIVLMASTQAYAGGAVQSGLGASALLLTLRRQPKRD